MIEENKRRQEEEERKKKEKQEQARFENEQLIQNQKIQAEMEAEKDRIYSNSGINNQPPLVHNLPPKSPGITNKLNSRPPLPNMGFNNEAGSNYNNIGGANNLNTHNNLTSLHSGNMNHHLSFGQNINTPPYNYQNNIQRNILPQNNQGNSIPNNGFVTSFGVNAHQPGVPIYSPHQNIDNQDREMEMIKLQLQRELDEIKRQAENALRERDESKRVLDDLNNELEIKIKEEEIYRDRLRKAMANTALEETKGQSQGKSPLKIYGIKGNSEYYEDIAASIALECQTKFIPFGLKGHSGSKLSVPKDSNLFGLLDDGSDVFKNIARKSYGEMIIGNSGAVGYIKTSKDMVEPNDGDEDLNHEKVFGDIEKIMNQYYEQKLRKHGNGDERSDEIS